jgi:valyl-tRNA synthetase
MPFLTEELWQRLAVNAAARPASIAQAAYPAYRIEGTDLEAERDMELLQNIIISARNLRAELKVDPKQMLEGALYSTSAAFPLAQRHRDAIRKLGNVNLEVHHGAAPKLQGVVRSRPEYDLHLEVPAAEIAALRTRLAKEVQQLETSIANLERQLGDNGFLGRAPAHVVEGMRAKLADYEAQLAKSRSTIDALGHD